MGTVPSGYLQKHSTQMEHTVGTVPSGYPQKTFHIIETCNGHCSIRASCNCSTHDWNIQQVLFHQDKRQRQHTGQKPSVLTSSWQVENTVTSLRRLSLRHYLRAQTDKAKDITPLTAWRREAEKEDMPDNLPWIWKDERGPSPIRQTLGLFQRQCWGNL